MKQDLKGRLHRGMTVVGVDNTEHGTIERFNDTHVYVRGRPIPHDAFEGIDGDRLYIGGRGTPYFVNQASAETLGVDRDIRVPVVEERVRVEKRVVDRGYIELRKTVITEQVMIPVELRREVIEVRRVDTQDGADPLADTPGAPAPFDPDVVRIPVLREKAIVQKEVVVAQEIVIERTATPEHQDIVETVRRQRVTVDETGVRERPTRQTGRPDLASGLAGRSAEAHDD
jgi:uncharacterized protein (TIGR02271 family)